MSSRLRSFIVSQELLRGVLHMPEGTIVHRILEDPLQYGASFRFVVSHPDLREVHEAQAIPEKTPVLVTRTILAGDCDPNKTFQEIEWKWDYE